MGVRRGWIVLNACILAVAAGCAALPPAIQIGSLALSGVSYLVTGKGPSDHMISAVAEQDCALLRIIRGKPVCVDAAIPENNPGIHDERQTRVAAAPARPPQPSPAVEPVRKGPIAPNTYVVLGSFRNKQNAQRWQGTLTPLQTSIARTVVDNGTGESQYRVIAGPWSESESLQHKRELTTQVQRDVWRVRLCPNTLSAPPCSVPATIARR